jgi:predicted nuclease of predicted toxin-antitoxin system
LKFLIDNALPPLLAVRLRGSSLDAVHVREYGIQQASDQDILERAAQEGRTIVSADTDFGTLLALHRLNHPSFILFRDPNLVTADDYHKVVLQLLAIAKDELMKGCVITVRPGRLRIRALPLLSERGPNSPSAE